MKKKTLLILLLAITVLFIGIGASAAESSTVDEELLISCPACGTPTHYVLTEYQQYECTETTHTLYDRYSGTCESCGHSNSFPFRDNPESHSFEHIHKEINGSYVDLYRCTVCGYESYNNY